MADKISDADLRKELMALGEKSIGPITETTRPLYVRKLTKLRSQKKAPIAINNVSRRVVDKKLLGFSSDESEEEHKEPPISKRQTRNSTKNTTTAFKVPNIAPAKAAALARPVLKSRYNSEKFEVNSNVVSNGSDKRFGVLNSINRTGLRNRKIEHAQDSSFSRPTRVNDDPFAGGLDDSTLLSLCKENHPGKSEFSDSDQEDGLDFTQASLDDTSRSYDEPEMVSHSVNTSATLDKSVLWNTSGRNTSGYVLSTNNRSMRSTGKVVPKLSPERYYDQTGVMGTDGFKAKERVSAYKLPHYISTFLVIFAVLFFVLIAFMYINMHQYPQNQPLGGQKNNLMICEQDPSERTEVCFTEAQVEGAKEIIKFLSARLTMIAGKIECGQYFGDKITKLKDIKKDIPEESAGVINVALTLVMNNPHWHIRLFDDEGNMLSSDGEMVLDKSELESKLNQVHGLDSTLPDMDVVCRLIRAVTHVLNTFVILCLVAFVVTAIITFVRYRWRKQKEEQQQVFDLVEQIIGILKEHHEHCLEDKDMRDYLPIPHVRDQLIPLKDRKKKKHVWDKAVQFLNANESRIRVETQKVLGEEFDVWRWLQTGAGAHGEKVWQGQAFESNMPDFTPLPCLKIRNMFNAEMEGADHDWHVKIQDAILEKSGVNHNIVHIAVDKLSKEGCVYVKCSSKEAAGRCFSALHGWWFDGKLVTVKFLRLKRYSERFPESVVCELPLQPSDNKKESLSQPFHKSFLEVY